MQVLFVGGPKHGKTSLVADDLSLMQFEDPSMGNASELYHRHRLPSSVGAVGIDVLFISSWLSLEEYEVKIREAFTIAAV
ncbi:hypothetical protein GFK26_03505 [Variovorax paradoxus]|uniref:Uncharacterized protein n=1 Tax=Variovorax paradoxus TaxID=34073 RepID=A0A5Q0LXA3_VARPD|nr:hypothetical protein [Variovorax paradoxus]QFZ81903.1 hypothetical protein GFK26_03505 [Variovorax paradoxus]